MDDEKYEHKIMPLAKAMIINHVDVCGLGMFSANEIAEEVLETLNKHGYDIVKK